MPAARRPLRRRALAAPILLCAALALLGAGAAASGADSSGVGSHASRSVATRAGAAWGATHAVTSIKATLTVPAISCTREAKDRALGQLLGVQLYGKHSKGGKTLPPDFSGILVKCSGKTPKYSIEFVRVNLSTGTVTYGSGALYRATYSPSGPTLRITPGNLVRLQIQDPGGSERLSITDLSTPKQRPITVTGPALRNYAGWKVGMFQLPGLSGPVPSTPALFTSVNAGGKVFGEFIGAYKTHWINSAGHTTASVGPSSRRKSEFTAFTSGTPRPWLSHNTTAGTASGDVRFKLPGTNQWADLNSIKELPEGTTIDTHSGHVELSFGLHHHQTQTAVLWGGKFKFTQNANGQTTFVVVGVNNGGSPYTASTANASRKKKKGKGLGSLWSSSHGNYSTQGNYGAAAVRGTTWLTQNEPNGTYFYVQPNHYDSSDKIVVTVFKPPEHTVTLGPGQSLLAPAYKAAPAITLGGATETDGRYNVQVGGTYSLTLLSPIRPVYIDAADAPLGPRGRDSAFFADGSSNGVPRWTINFQITPNLSNFQTWNVGVLIGNNLYVVPLRLVS